MIPDFSLCVEVKFDVCHRFPEYFDLNPIVFHIANIEQHVPRFNRKDRLMNSFRCRYVLLLRFWKDESDFCDLKARIFDGWKVIYKMIQKSSVVFKIKTCHDFVIFINSSGSLFSNNYKHMVGNVLLIDYVWTH